MAASTASASLWPATSSCTARTRAPSIETSFSVLSADVADAEQWAALHYAFTAHRAAIKVTIQPDGTGAALLPFVNTRYDNRLAWNTRGAPLRFWLPSGRECSMREYYARKAGVFGTDETQDPGFVPHEHGWWLNGHTLCNVVPANLWSLRGVAEVGEMLAAAAPQLAAAGASGCFVLNKRDSPILPIGDTAHPFPALVRTADARMHPMYVRSMRPPLSFYVGPAWRDVALPLPEAWRWATRPDEDGGGALLARCFAMDGRLDMAWFAAKRRQAVFRGSTTGPGIGAGNQRLALARLAGGALDVGITAWNARDRVHGGAVRYQDRVADVPLVAQLPPAAQAEYRVIVYVCGHQAASRLIWHLAAGSALVLVDPAPDILAPRMWLHDYLEEGVHYVRARADLSDIQAVVSRLLTDDAAAGALASGAYAIANRVLRPAALAEATARAFSAAATSAAAAYP